MKRLVALLLPALLLSGCKDQVEQSVAPPQAPAMSWEDGAQASGKNAYLHTQAFCEIGDRRSGSPGYEEQIRYIEEKLAALGWATERHNFDTDGVKMTNLVATFGSNSPSASPRPLLLSCHIDTKVGIEGFVGANDGASGAAALIEIARILSQQPAQAEKVEMIFLDGEESCAWHMTEDDGLYGSKWDVERRQTLGHLPTWQINLDMVGGRRIPIAPPAMDTSDEMYAHYSAAINTLGLNPERWTIAPSSYMDDHLPYLQAGVDSLNLIGLFVGTTWWHTAGDDMSIICPNALRDSCRMTLQLIEQLLK